MNQRRVVKIKRNAEKKFNWSKFFYWLVFLAFMGVIFYMLFFSGKLLVSSIDLEGTETLDPDSIKETINNDISGKYFNFLDKNNLILLRTSKIKKDISSGFKKLDRVEVKRVFPDKLQARVHERKSVLVFCGSDCYVMDENGIAYIKSDLAAEEIADKKLITLSDNSRKSFNENDMVLKKEYIDFILSVKNKLENDFGIPVAQDWETPTLISYDLRIKTNEGWKIYFNKEIGLDKELEMLRVVLDNKIPYEQRPNLEYIDLRSDNKVYYKFKDGMQQEEVKSEEEKVEEQPKAEEKKNNKKKNH